jgi:hypothetical protein
MKSNFKTKLLAGLLLANVALFSQMNYMATSPHKLNLQNTPVAITPLYSGAPATDAYSVANSAFDVNGKLLFYIKDENVFNASGVIVGQLGGGYIGGSCEGGYLLQTLREIAIVPVPGSCNDYYAIFIKTSPNSGSYAYYTKINCTGGVITVTNASGPYSNTCNKVFFSGYQAFGIGACGDIPGGIAVSQIVSGSGSTAKRFLYVAGGTSYTSSSSITKYDITSTGIANPGSFGVIPGLVGTDYGTMELELSSDGQWLAWSNYGFNNQTGTKVFVQKLFATSTGLNSGIPQIYTLNAIKGLEFDKTPSNPNLYVAGGTTASNVLAKINTATQVVTNITPSLDVSNTFLELAKNGNILALAPFKSLLRLVELNTTTNVMTWQYDYANSKSTIYGFGGVATLPDQIDGEDYTSFTGQQYVAIAGITLNSQVLGATCSTGNPSLYNCAAINLNATYLNGISTGSSYKVEIHKLDGSCVNIPLINDPTALNYVGTWITSAVPANLLLSNLYDVYNNSLISSHAGSYSVSVSVQDACGNVSIQSGIFNLLEAVFPNPLLEIYNTYFTSPANTYLPAGTTPGAAILTGALTAGFRINGSTGNVTSYNITIDQVSNTGVYIKNIYNTTTATSNITAVPPLSLNSLCVSAAAWSPVVSSNPITCTSISPPYTGWTGYWGYTNGLNSVGNYYKITLTLSNPCSSTSAFSYLYVNNGYARMANPNALAIADEPLQTNLAVYPNPSSNLINFALSSEADDVYTIEVYDVRGNKVATIATNQALSKGTHTVEFNNANLPTGIYTYKINSNTLNKTGTLQIVK